MVSFRRGIAEVFVYSVDNALCQVADPEFVGYCFINSIDFGNKVLQKTDPNERSSISYFKLSPILHQIGYHETQQIVLVHRSQFEFICLLLGIGCCSIPTITSSEWTFDEFFIFDYFLGS